MVFPMSKKLCLPLVWLVLGATLTAGPDQYGKQHEFKEMNGGYTVLDFAASWCKPCWKALPHVEALAAEMKDVRVLVICQDKKVTGRDRLVEKLNLTVPVIWDKDHAWAEHFAPPGMPTTMILSPTGEVIYRQVGYSPKSWQALRKTLARLVEQDTKTHAP